MQLSIILAHPNRDSFNHIIAQVALAALRENGRQVIWHDLYAEQFDPLLPGDEIAREAVLSPEVAAHCREIATADGLIIVHPNWWGQPPAILKGWVDRDAWPILEQYPRATFAVLDKAGHNLQIEQADLFTALVSEWLDRVEAER